LLLSVFPRLVHAHITRLISLVNFEFWQSSRFVCPPGNILHALQSCPRHPSGYYGRSYQQWPKDQIQTQLRSTNATS
jgi:hypothetical protein